jgi:hypothetical protein
VAGMVCSSLAVRLDMAVPSLKVDTSYIRRKPAPRYSYADDRIDTFGA